MIDFHIMSQYPGEQSQGNPNLKLSELARLDMERWLKIDGKGFAKATALVTSFEQGRRTMFEQPEKRIKINCS
jgi:DNA repair protein RadC